VFTFAICRRPSVCRLSVDCLSTVVCNIQILDTLRFEPPFGGLGITYNVHLELIGKRVVLIELFS